MKRSFRLSHLFTKDQYTGTENTASFLTIIIAGWKASGIDMTFKDGNIISITLNRSRVL